MLPSNHSDSLALMQVDQKSEITVTDTETHHGGFSQAQFIMESTKKLEEDMRNLGVKIKQHEGNIKTLKTEMNKLDESIVDLQVVPGNHRSLTTSNNSNFSLQSKEETYEQILRHEKSAASILCQLKRHHRTLPSDLPLFNDVFGIVATLGKVDDDNLSRLLSEYLGAETMMAIVCKTYEGVKALEIYNKEGNINKQSGLHGLGTSIGRILDGRFNVICLEGLRPYCGEFVPDDPQRRLNLLKPRLPNGEIPPGFISFAVNMVDLEPDNLFYVTGSGYGLRETLFYYLFSRLQVYKTREDMMRSVPLISDGAISLDGGMIKGNGVFCLGNRNDINISFPKSSALVLPNLKLIETERQLAEMKLKKDKVYEDITREQVLLDAAKINFAQRKQDYIKFLAEIQLQSVQAAR